MDQQYGEAFHLLGMIHKRGGNDELARRAFAQAHARVGASEQSPKRRLAADEGTPPRFFGTGVRRNKRLMTGGDQRLAEALRKDALKAFLTGNPANR